MASPKDINFKNPLSSPAMNTTFTSVIIDDEQDAIDGLRQVLQQVTPKVTVVGTARNAQTGLDLIIDEHPDLIFLDVNMPGHDGFWLADKLKHFENGSDIIFVTAYDEYAIKAIKYSAFDFLVKPVSPDDVQNSILRYRNLHQPEPMAEKLQRLTDYVNQAKLKLNTLYGFVMVSPKDIVYSQAEGAYCRIFLTNGKEELLSMHLKLLEEKLPSQTFLRINRSTTINLDYLESFNRKTKTVTLVDVLQHYEFMASHSGAKKLKQI